MIFVSLFTPYCFSDPFFVKDSRGICCKIWKVNPEIQQ